MKRILLLIALVISLSGCVHDNPDITSEIQDNDFSVETDKDDHIPNYINVKYRTGVVDVGETRFEYLDTSKSSFVRGAYYDIENNYMIVRLNSTYYHYCGLPSSVWDSFKRTSSFGTFYNSHIKGSYDCRLGFVPEYD